MLEAGHVLIQYDTLIDVKERARSKTYYSPPPPTKELLGHSKE